MSSGTQDHLHWSTDLADRREPTRADYVPRDLPRADVVLRCCIRLDGAAAHHRAATSGRWSPTLLISAGTAIERHANVLYDQAARGPVEHWNLPDAHHADAIRDGPADYEKRVIGFLDEALR